MMARSFADPPTSSLGGLHASADGSGAYGFGVDAVDARLPRASRKRDATLLVAVMLCLVGCGFFPPRERSVPLITGDPLDGGCFAANVSGLLVVDPKYGTAIVGGNGPSMVQLSDVPVPVAWRSGFTGRLSRSEVEVLDRQGNVVATTGRNYEFFGGYISAALSPGLKWPDLPTQAIYACGDAQPLP
jgi:hypothetical protein